MIKPLLLLQPNAMVYWLDVCIRQQTSYGYSSYIIVWIINWLNNFIVGYLLAYITLIMIMKLILEQNAKWSTTTHWKYEKGKNIFSPFIQLTIFGRQKVNNDFKYIIIFTEVSIRPYKWKCQLNLGIRHSKRPREVVIWTVPRG